MKPNILAIILTYNEEQHIGRCISSVKKIASNILIVDSYSTDKTVNIALNHGALVLSHEYINHAKQFNWALDQVNPPVKWILRIDADEYLDEKLILEIKNKISNIPEDIKGINVNRRIDFLGDRINYGGLFPIKILRLFRYGFGHCENRWMDEHIIVEGSIINFDGEIVDNNLNNLTWWINKHNAYASREALDILNREFKIFPMDSVGDTTGFEQAKIKRWLKENIYSKLPLGFRALIYFNYRFIFRFGFMDKKQGRIFHILQGFWYRYLVDAKVFEVKKFMSKENVSVETAIEKVLSIKCF